MLWQWVWFQGYANGGFQWIYGMSVYAGGGEDTSSLAMREEENLFLCGLGMRLRKRGMNLMRNY